MSTVNYSVMVEINKTEEAIKTTYERIHALEQKLRVGFLEENKKNQIQQELVEVRKLLQTHEEQLAHLRTHNRKTFILAVSLIFIIFAVYMLYILIWNPIN
ncbi:uncharacterized protein LOC130444101 [Diorhabda sublineata]|uniref:uncharacterized protein LOC130444101 n=1 Tax=Diorhabda sublineata TaxID=1163346 RepID=UPI0024E181D1|nr:uncharacterized protein LOC130444101 [Diorhabda sublineata]